MGQRNLDIINDSLGLNSIIVDIINNKYRASAETKLCEKVERALKGLDTAISDFRIFFSGVWCILSDEQKDAITKYGVDFGYKINSSGDLRQVSEPKEAIHVINYYFD